MTDPIVTEQDYVTFYSPGTFMSEQTSKMIPAWDVQVAMEMAHEISERHGTTPYAFSFSTRGRGVADLDSREIRRSQLYYLGGKIETRAEVEARNDPSERVMRDTMRINNIERVIVNTNSWRFTGALRDGDVVLDFVPRKKPTPVDEVAEQVRAHRGEPA